MRTRTRIRDDLVTPRRAGPSVDFIHGALRRADGDHAMNTSTASTSISRQSSESPRAEAPPGAEPPSIVSQDEWTAAHEAMMTKEKAFTRLRDALAAERRRMPWVAVEKPYRFEGPKGKATL